MQFNGKTVLVTGGKVMSKFKVPVASRDARSNRRG
jgi:hypothetical protein